MNMMWPTGEVNFDYGNNGLTSWSFYIRAFNLAPGGFGDAEFGWGQWSKPSSTDINFNDVCAINPLGFTCENGENGGAGCITYDRESLPNTQPACEKSCKNESDEEKNGVSNCLKSQWTDNVKQFCGSADYSEREKCEYWICGNDNKGGVVGSIEGGMGYWPYTLEKKQVTWMLPGATTSNYEMFAGTFLVCFFSISWF